MSRRTGALAALTLALAVFLVDRGLKSVVEGSMRLGESIVLIPNFLSITYIKNEGGAFGILAGNRSLLLAGSALAVGVVLWMLLAGRPSKLTAFGCGLILGGAAGNLLDRLSSGEVTDYVHFSFWYIFNAADAAIVVGVAALLLAALRPERAAQPARIGDEQRADR